MIRPFRGLLKGIALVMLFSSFSSLFVFSQPPADSLQAAILLQQATELADAKDYASSNNTALQAAEAFAQLGLWGEVQKSYRRIFLNGYFSNTYEQTIALLNEGIEKVPKDQLLLRAKIHSYLGYSYESTGAIIRSVEAYEKSIPLLSQIKDSTSLYTSYTNVGSGYIQFSDFSKAIVIFKRAQALEKAISNVNSIWINKRLLGQAYLYKGEWENAYRTFKAAQKIQDRLDGTFERYYAEIYLGKKEYGKALRFAQEAIRLGNESGPSGADSVVEAKRVMSEIYLSMAQPQKALALIEEILPSYREDPNRRDLGKCYMLLGESHQDLGAYDEALAAFQQTFETFLPGFKATGPASYPAKELWTREHYLPYVFNRKGDCFYEKYRAGQEVKWLHLAEENYELAVDCVQNVLLNYDETESRLARRDLTHSFYEKAIRSKLELYTLTKQRGYQAEAFRIAQQANAFVLRELLNEQKSLRIAGVPEAEIETLKQYQKSINLLGTQIEEAAVERIDSLQGLLVDLKNKTYQWRRKIEKEYPKFARLRNDLEVAEISALQNKMDHASLLVKYFRGDEKLYVFSLSPADFSVEVISLPADFDTLIYQYRRAISDLDFINTSTEKAEQEYLHAAHQLYQLLLEKPLQKQQHNSQIKRLTIVGDGALSAIPFQALLVQKSNSWKDPEHLLLSRYALSYSYYCKLLLDADEPIHQANSFVSFGIEFDEYTLKYLQEIAKDKIENKALQEHLRSGNFSPLPFSDDEAKEVAELMEGQSWLNLEATKFKFLQSSPHASIVHLATHSILDVEQPNQSALVFTKTRDSLDNLLRLSEIYNLEMRAEMLVLSACNTGFGPIARGEGINSLARAFNISGVPSVMATLWGISDESSKKIMKLYYEFLKKGMSKDIALQKAQLEFLHNDKVSSPSFRLPVYWAAWVPIGEQRSIDFAAEKEWSFYLLLLGLFGLVFYLGTNLLSKNKV